MTLTFEESVDAKLSLNLPVNLPSTILSILVLANWSPVLGFKGESPPVMFLVNKPSVSSHCDISWIWQ